MGVNPHAQQPGDRPNYPRREADSPGSEGQLAGDTGTERQGRRLSFGRRLRRHRMHERDWSQERLAQQMHLIGEQYGGAAKVPSLRIMISKWEKERKIPNQRNRHLLAEALGIPVEHLGLERDPDYRWPPPSG
jgi:hypothetical protein